MYTATYSPDDNKLRLYASTRLDSETYARVKAAGFRWAPKQDLFVAPAWSVDREDLLIELAGEIDDEDKTLVQRAEERADRFEDYSGKRMAEAEATRKTVDQIAERFYMGQPILVGHHSEKGARKDQERIQNGMRKAIKLWDTSGYWKSRAAGALAAAKYKELPAVRARRIKGLESDLRKVEKETKQVEKELKAWKACEGLSADPEKQRAVGLYIANFSGYWSMSFSLADYPRDPPASQYEGPMGVWSAIDGNVITAAQAAAICIPALERSIPRKDRWIAHYENRLAYERAMLAEAGGTVTDQTKPEVGGAIRSWHFWGGWSYIAKVNKVTVTIYDPVEYGDKCYRATVPFDKIAGVMSAAEVNMAKQEGRIRETGKGGRITGFALLELAPQETPAPIAPDPVQAPTPAPYEAMKATLKAGGVKVVVAPTLFPTPPAIAAKAVELAEIGPGDIVLEPSAGTGALLDAIQAAAPGASTIAVEINGGLCEILRQKGFAPQQADFLELEDLAPVDRAIMNPPFDRGADVKHIRKAFGLLRPGGRLVAICANGPRQQAAFRDQATYWEDLPAGTFSGTDVRSALLILEKAPS